MTAPDPATRARRILRQRLESLQRYGVTQLPLPRPAPPLMSPPVSEVVESVPIATPVATSPAVAHAEPPSPSVDVHTPAPRTIASPPPLTEEPMPRAAKPTASPKLPGNKAERIAALEEMRCEVAACTRCKELVKNRTQTVFGVGNPLAKICFFGEAPGADEDASGEPFVGRAGQLLNKIIEACTFRREDVYILNVLKCRPPNNRPPEEDEAANCRPFFERQLEIIRPQYVVCLGASAAKALLQSPFSIGKLRGKFHQYDLSQSSVKVLATYHPAYLLRNPAAKADVWEDMKLLMKDMGIEIPRKS